MNDEYINDWEERIMAYFDEMNTVYKDFFNDPYPARTCVAVYELPLGADVEIEVIVKKPN